MFLSQGTGDLFKGVMCVEGAKKQGKGERRGGEKERKERLEGQKENKVERRKSGEKQREREKRIEGGTWDAIEKKKTREEG